MLPGPFSETALSFKNCCRFACHFALCHGREGDTIRGTDGATDAPQLLCIRRWRMIPRRFTCDGQNLSPPLAWTDVPNGAHSLVMLCDDPDAPGGTWHHWAVYDVPWDRAGLPEGVSPGDDGFKQATNDFRRVGYGGPCPPHGHGPHHYHFRLLALSVGQLRPRRSPSCEEVEREARQHIIAEATLVGVYKR